MWQSNYKIGVVAMHSTYASTGATNRHKIAHTHGSSLLSTKKLVSYG
jgi:hypothetical protein